MERREFVRSASVLAAASVAETTRQKLVVSDPSARRTGAGLTSAPGQDSLDAVVRRAMELAGVPGVAVGTLRSGKVAEQFWGIADTRTNIPIAADSRFEAASLSKPVTAFLVLLLVERGKFDLDRPLAHFGVPMPNAADPRAARITARHVLSHSSGWRNWRRPNDPPLTADFDPGTRYQYSGEGFVQLQRVIEQITDRGFAELATELVFGPLEMTRSTFLTTAKDFGSALVTGHGAQMRPRESFGQRVGRHLESRAPTGRSALSMRVSEVEALLPTMDPPWPAIPTFVMPNAAGSLVTTVSDYLRFWSHILTEKAPGASALAQMSKLETPINSELSWGLGIARDVWNGELGLWHHGDNPGFKNFVAISPRPRSAVLVFTNADSGMRVAERAVRVAIGRDHAAFAWI